MECRGLVSLGALPVTSEQLAQSTHWPLGLLGRLGQARQKEVGNGSLGARQAVGRERSMDCACLLISMPFSVSSVIEGEFLC